MSVTRPVYDARWVVLEALADGPLSGYEIGCRCEGRVVGRSLAWLYPLLYRLEAGGAITGRWRTGDRGRRRLYSILRFSRPRSADRTGPANPIGAPRTPPVAGSIGPSGSASTYLDRMTRVLGLPSSQAEEIRHEIEGHLIDAGVLDSGGADTGAAEAERLFGQPEQLGGAIASAQRQRQTFSRTLLTSLLVAPGLLFFGAIAAAFCLSFVRVAVYIALKAATGAAVCTGTLALDQRQQVLPIVVGAFIAGRFMAGRMFALGSRRSSVAVVIAAAIGAVLLGLPALVLRVDLDILTAAVMVGIPTALIAGTIRPVRYSQDLLSRRGVVAAVALGFALIALPIDGMLVYSAPSGIANVGAVTVETGREAYFDKEGLNVSVSISDPRQVASVCLEVQAVVRHGWFLDRDPAIAGFSQCDSAIQNYYVVSWQVPPPTATGREWLLLVTVVDENGQRHLVSVNMALVVPYRGSVLGWLTGEPGD